MNWIKDLSTAPMSKSMAVLILHKDKYSYWDEGMYTKNQWWVSDRKVKDNEAVIGYAIIEMPEFDEDEWKEHFYDPMPSVAGDGA